ncbi:ARM repeat superfamily protein [Prunus dulcis]|uniref:ARM repeat superfamily protein n=1 Tax=Prunus dulcis TaxID=3755 RepID=A0A4Y1RYM0_PRUDU|nr:ARM repeat superfamily protein [Prunus dulcis]
MKWSNIIGCEKSLITDKSPRHQPSNQISDHPLIFKSARCLLCHPHSPFSTLHNSTTTIPNAKSVFPIGRCGNISDGPTEERGPFDLSGGLRRGGEGEHGRSRHGPHRGPPRCHPNPNSPGRIVTCVPGEGSVKDNPVIHCLDRLNQLNAVQAIKSTMRRWSYLINLQSSVIPKVQKGCEHAIVSALKALAFLLHDLKSRETFRASDGPKLVVGIITDGFENIDILSSGFAVIAAAATGNEVLKELFVELKIEELILRVLSVKREASIQSVYDAIWVLLTPDDNRVLASQVFGYARKFAKIGIARALVDSIRAGLSSSSLVSASIALKAVAVNDEICTSISENGGVDAVLVCIDDSSEQGNKTVAKLAGSDANKTAIVEKKGMDRLIKLSARFFDDPSVLQEVPENAARAIEAGAGELALQAMQKFPAAQQMQKNSCLMIRNLNSSAY